MHVLHIYFTIIKKKKNEKNCKGCINCKVNGRTLISKRTKKIKLEILYL